MLKRTRRHLWRLAVLLGKVCATTVALVFVAFTLLIWRANQGPIVIDSLAPQLAQLLSNQDTGIHTVVDHAQLAWDRNDQALRLQTTGVRVFDRSGHRLANLPRLDLGLNFLASLRGQLAPLEIYASDITMRLTRLSTGGVQFGDTTQEGMPETPPLTHADIVQLVQESLQLRPAWFGLGRVGAVRLARVQIVIADGSSRTEWGSLSIPRLEVVRRLSDLRLSGTVTAQLGDTPASLQLSALHNHRRGDLVIETELSAFNPQPWLEAFGLHNYGNLAAQLHGKVNVRLDENVVVQQVDLKLQSKSGQLNLPQLWPQPQPFTDLSLQARLEPARRQLTLTDAALGLDGVKLGVTGTVMSVSADEFALEAEAVVKDWPLDKVAALWPERVAPNPRAWITSHMSRGVFRSASAKLQARGDWREPEELRAITLQASLALDNATVDYLDGMPPVTGISGEATADQDSLHIKTKGGKAQNVVLSESAITIAGLTAADQTIDIRLTAQSKISDVMQLIDHPPLKYASKLGLKPEAIVGKADLELHLAFPLLRSLSLTTMEIACKAKLQGMASDQLIKGLAISDGALDLGVDSQKLNIVGMANFNGVRLTADYRQNFSAPDTPASAVKAALRGKLTADDLNKLGLPIAAGLMLGAMPAQIDYEQPFTGAATLAAQVDFSPVQLQFPRLGWDKPEKQPATGQFKILLNKEQPVLQEAILKGEGLNVRLSGSFSPELQMQELTCKPCSIGRNDFTAQLGFQAGHLRDIAVSGKSLDWRSVPDEVPPRLPDPKSAPLPLNITLNLEKLYRSPQAYFSAVRGTLRRDAVGWDKMEVRAVAAGRVPLVVNLLPQANKTRKFTVVTDDLGDVLRAANVTDQVHEGKLLINGNSTAQEPYRIMGKIQLNNYRVRKLPVLAVLLNAVSITGLADLMAGEGLNFDRLEGGFDWNGQRLGLDDVRTAGGALGLNVEGEMDFAANRINLRGTVVPFSFFNAVIGVIPIVGDVLTGGKGGGVVAATYQAKGKLDDPEISVNPVSFLAPGILRRIFFQD